MLDQKSFGVWKFMKTGHEFHSAKHAFENFAKLVQLQALLFWWCKPQIGKPQTSKLHIFSRQLKWTQILHHLYFWWRSYGHLKLDFFAFQCIWSKVTYNVLHYHMYFLWDFEILFNITFEVDILIFLMHFIPPQNHKKWMSYVLGKLT